MEWWSYVQSLEQKEALEASDVAQLLQFLQEHTAPLLSLRNTTAASAIRQTNGPREADNSKREITSPKKQSQLSGSEHLSYHKDGRKTVSGSSSYNLGSLEDFPRMESAASTSSGYRKKGLSSQPIRRITLTPLGPQSTWRSNPAFTSHFSSSECPLPLTEERKLLQQERSKQRHGGAAPRSGSSHKGHHDSIQQLGSRSPLMRRKRPQGDFQESPSHNMQSTQSRNSYMKEESLDSKISSHSIFALSHSHRRQKKDAHSSSFPSQGRSDTPLTYQQSPNLSWTMPLTSTPFLAKHQQVRVSLAKVTNKESLESLAEVYAKLIKVRLVPNITSEIHFIIQLLTATVPHSEVHKFANGSMELFNSPANCVYFAVKVLSKITRLLTALDRPTLQLLAENIRIAELHPELAAFFVDACESTWGQSSSYHTQSQDSVCIGVPFQEDTDNSKNFPNVRAFHAFKKQRDSFYSVLREWEKHHERHNWNMQIALGEKIRSLIRQSTEVCSHAHFARLFQKQLTESCKHTTDAADTSNSLVGHLKKVDPDKLMRLSERFLQSRRGPCPPPAFSQREEFFSGFVLAADSYTFNHHLMATVYGELMKLHSSSCSVQPRELPSVLHTMRTLAKFLGFLEFLPYQNSLPEALLSTRNGVHQFNILQCVEEAIERGHLCVTIPWVVEYLSMMDLQATMVDHYTTLLRTLINVYRSVSLEMYIDGGAFLNLSSFMVVTSLGWLFEIPNMSTGVFFECVKGGDHNMTLPCESEGLDSQDVVTKELLYACCPFLGEIHSMLAEFAAGLQCRPSPIRKIKPIPAEINPTESTPANQLQLQLQENFYRGHPPYLRQLCDIVAERIGATAISHCESHVMSKHVADGVSALAQWMKEKCNAVEVGMNTSAEGFELYTQMEAERKLNEVSEAAMHMASKAVTSYFPIHCQTQSQAALELFLDGAMAKPVIAIASSITAAWASERCSKWAAEKLRAVIHEDLSRRFDRLKKAVKPALKEGVVSFSLTSEIGAPSINKGECLVSPNSETSIVVEEFKELAGKVLQQPKECPITDQLEGIDSILARLTATIEAKCCVLPGILFPQLMSSAPRDILNQSVDLAALMVSHGLLSLLHSKHLDLMKGFVTLWKLLKNLKLDFPAERLMSSRTFQRYIEQQQKGQNVWHCLSDVLLACVHSDIVSSAVVEALWLCRKQQLKLTEVQYLLKAAIVFLNAWYSQSECLKGYSTSYISFKEVHFVRLLSVVLQECDRGDIPPAILSHSHLKEVVHPF